MENEEDKLRFENGQLRGRIDFLTNQIRIIKDNPYTDETTKMWCDSILKTITNDPI